jgi:hypothetical protein
MTTIASQIGDVAAVKFEYFSRTTVNCKINFYQCPYQMISNYTAALAAYILEGSIGSSTWLPKKVTVAIPGITLNPAFEA